MKKLMFVAALATVGSAFAIESANVVGYQGQDLTGKVYNSIGATFETVGTNGKVKLADMTPAGFVYSSETLQVLSSTDANTIAKYSYVTPEFAEEDFEDPEMQGWWIKNKEGEDDKYRADDVQVDVGSGFLGSFGKKKVNFTYAGQVTSGSQELDLTGKIYNMVANFLPIDIKLGDVVANGFVYSSETLQVLSTTDANTIAKYSYVTAEMAEEDFEDPDMQGWWIKNKEGEDEKYRADDVIWASGQAMLGSFGKKKVKLVFPDPLNYNAK